MQFKVNFKQMEATDALKSYAREKMERVQKYFTDPISVSVRMSAEKRRHTVDVGVQLTNGFSVAGSETTENMYSSIDMVVAKLERQIRRYKDKLKSKRHVAAPIASLRVPHTVFEQATDAAGDNSAPSVTVKREDFDAMPMTVPDAVMQMNLNHQQFLVFRNSETKAVNVLYRREENIYGLIET